MACLSIRSETPRTDGKHAAAPSDLPLIQVKNTPNGRQTCGNAVRFTVHSGQKHPERTANTRQRRPFYRLFRSKTPRTDGKHSAAPSVLPLIQVKNTPNGRQTLGSAVRFTAQKISYRLLKMQIYRILISIKLFFLYFIEMKI